MTKLLINENSEKKRNDNSYIIFNIFLFISQNEKLNDIMHNRFNYENFHFSFAEIQIIKNIF